MASKINLNNVGWRAVLKNVAALAGYPAPPNNGIPTMTATLDQMAANQNDLIDRVAKLEARPPVPFPAAL